MVSGAYFEDDSETTTKDGDTKLNNRRYFRVLKSLDVTGPDGGNVKETIGNIFNNLSMKASIEGVQTAEDSSVSEWIEQELKSMSYLHWRARPHEDTSLRKRPG